MSEEKQQLLHHLSMQLQQLEQYMRMLEEQTQELALARESMQSIQTIKPGTETYVPLTNGIYVKATLDTTNEFLMNIGNNVITAQTPAQAEALLAEQEEELVRAQENLSKQFSDLYQKYIQTQISIQEG